MTTHLLLIINNTIAVVYINNIGGMFFLINRNKNIFEVWAQKLSLAYLIREYTVLSTLNFDFKGIVYKLF